MELERYDGRNRSPLFPGSLHAGEHVLHDCERPDVVHRGPPVVEPHPAIHHVPLLHVPSEVLDQLVPPCIFPWNITYVRSLVRGSGPPGRPARRAPTPRGRRGRASLNPMTLLISATLSSSSSATARYLYGYVRVGSSSIGSGAEVGYVPSPCRRSRASERSSYWPWRAPRRRCARRAPCAKLSGLFNHGRVSVSWRCNLYLLGSLSLGLVYFRRAQWHVHRQHDACALHSWVLLPAYIRGSCDMSHVCLFLVFPLKMNGN
jgi:hypothetical protein